MRALAFPALLLTFAVTQPAYSQYDFDDFLKAVESGQQKSTTLNSPRLAQAPSAIEELPAPKPSVAAPLDLEPSGLSSVSDGPIGSNLPQKNAAAAPVPANQTNQPDTGAFQPIPIEAPDQPQSLVMPNPVLPHPINFDEVFEQQNVGLSQQGDYGAAGACAGGCSERGCNLRGGSPCESSSSNCQSCAVMTHYQANLPAPSTLRGYFNASPCIANVWDGYACDAAKECQKTQQHLQSGHARQAVGCTTCQGSRH